jgi:TrmH family RNA methyltransferase
MMLTKNQLKAFRSLKEKRGRTAQGKFLIEGVHLCREALRANENLDLILYTQAAFQIAEVKALVVEAQNRGIANMRISSPELNTLADTVTPQGVIAVARQRVSPSSGHRGKVLVLLDRVRDPGNVGTIIRTADAVGADGVFLSSESADPFSPKVIRSTQGSIFHIPVHMDVDPETISADLKRSGFRVFIAEPRAKHTHTQVRFPRRFLLVVGNETKGVRSQLTRLADELICVPLRGQAESLNVSIAAGVILYEALRQREARKQTGERSRGGGRR